MFFTIVIDTHLYFCGNITKVQTRHIPPAQKKIDQEILMDVSAKMV
jgi:hypothetical protein